ncbi:hypothetical protein VIGAN_04098600 [Vigna angularis var. angularis]|uniref:Uncharacterized protein n=1 Tax=Vigna angularis var. angularis TaxID=157739 RepID=A0A0S3RT79_PHAAN|nr:hypothetical protein VIGAN_04098600 [Vigna angularis var. angularis]
MSFYYICAPLPFRVCPGPDSSRFGSPTTPPLSIPFATNLNVNDSVGSNIRKSKVDAKSSLEIVTTFGKCEMGANLLEKFEKLNLVKENEGFVFTSKQDSLGLSFVEFETPAPKVGKEGKLKQKSSKIRMSRSRENLKHYSTTQRWHGKGFVSKESVSQDQLHDSSMDVSPHQEKMLENEW